MKLKYVLLGAATILGTAHLLKKTRRRQREPLRHVNAESDVTPSKVFGTYEGHLDKMPKLEYLIEHELFYTCQLMPTDFFVKYCLERGLKISREQLIEFERLGVFFPFARVRPAANVQWFWKEQVNGLLEINALEQPSLTRDGDSL